MKMGSRLTNITFGILIVQIMLLFSSSCRSKSDKRQNIDLSESMVADPVFPIKRPEVTEQSNLTSMNDANRKDTLTFTFNTKGIFLDSIQYSIFDTDDESEYFLHFYYKGRRYSEEAFLGNISYNDVNFQHMNNDKYKDLVIINSAASGQGCFMTDIYLFDPITFQYKPHKISGISYIGYNRKLDIYSGYSRGSGQGGPWNYSLLKLENDSLIEFESLLHESEVVYRNHQDKTYELEHCYTHIYYGDTTTYANLSENEVNENIGAASDVKTLDRRYFINKKK